MLEPGQAKRVPSTGVRVLGYYIACPGCMWVGRYSVETLGSEETATGKLTAITKAVKCQNCFGRLELDGDQLSCVDQQRCIG